MDTQTKPLSPIAESTAELLKQHEQQQPHLPEPIFVEHILPMLAGDVDFDIDKYLQVAELPQNPIKVFNREGNILFTVPPLLRDVHFRSSETGVDSVMEIMANAENQARISPKLGVGYLQRALQDKIEPRKLGEMVSYIDQLNVIFKRYDKPLVALPDDVRATISKLLDDKSSSSSDNDVDFVPDDYEEL